MARPAPCVASDRSKSPFQGVLVGGMNYLSGGPIHVSFTQKIIWLLRITEYTLIGSCQTTDRDYGEPFAVIFHEGSSNLVTFGRCRWGGDRIADEMECQM